VAGRIRDDDIAAVRESVRIDDVIGEHVTLKPAGAGSLKGLCPFHDEKSPSFNVRPALGYYHCFGCGEGGDVISFVQKVDGLTFVEAVERLAVRAGITLTYVEGGPSVRRDVGQRARLVAAHAAAAEFYRTQLHSSPAAQAGRSFLTDRGFDADAATTFGVGFSPRDGESLLRHLRGLGFSDDELVTAGLVARGQRGPYDRFRGRLMWPIREVGGDVVGFGARRLFDDDRVEAKYLNTGETPIYHKSRVLYGIDLARRQIAQRSQAVVVEGYTDVMACHLAGVGTAVATCGTAFGDEHGRLLRRLLLDDAQFRGEVIFAFDGDEAGQKAALRTFHGDKQFVAQTYVAVEPTGLDPCELRQRAGDAAVRELVARRVPLYRFVLGSVIGRYDLDRADGRIDALRAAAPLVASVRDRAKIGEYARELAHMTGLDVDEVRREVNRAASGRGRSARRAGPDAAPDRPRNGSRPPDPLSERQLQVEREVLKLAVQRPALAGPAFDAIPDDAFTYAPYRAVKMAIGGAGGAGASAGGEAWVQQVSAAALNDEVRSELTGLAVEPLHLQDDDEAAARYAESLIARVQELALDRAITELKSRLERMNPLTATDEYNRLFGALITAERQRQQLRERAAGGVR